MLSLDRIHQLIYKLRAYLTHPITAPSPIVYISFILTLTLNVIFMVYDDYLEKSHKQQQYDIYLIEMRLKIHERAARYINLSKSGAGLFIANTNVSLDMWDSFVLSILDKESYPAIMGLSFIEMVSLPQRAQFQATMNKLYPYLNFKYNEHYPDQFIVKYVLPQQYHIQDLNCNKALGLNIYDLDNLFTTFQHARQVNRQSLLPGTKIIPCDVLKNKPAIVLVTPIYKENRSFKTDSEQFDITQSFLGWISTPIDIKKFFEDLITPSIHITVRDSDTNVVIFDSNPHLKVNVNTQQSFTYSFAERHWTVDVNFLNDDTTLYFSNSTLLDVCGLILCLLLTSFIWTLTISKKRAQALTKQIELNLEHTKNRTRTILENIPGAVFQCLPKNNSNIQYISHYIEQLTGYKPDVFINGTYRLSDIIHAADLAMVQSNVGDIPIPGHSYYIEYRIVHNDGTIRWLSEHSVVINDTISNDHYLTGVIFDITDRKLKDKDVRRMTMALQNTVEGIVFVDPDLNYIRLNQAFAEMIGRSENELIGKSWLMSIHASDQQKILDGLPCLVSQNKFSVTVRGLHIDGHLVHQYIVIVAVRDDDGKLESYYGFIRDITQSKREEEALSIAVQEAQQANDMKSKFLAMITHELRTPLNAIIGYSEMLIEEINVADTKSMIDDLNKIVASGKHLLHLINDILDISKLEAGKMTVYYEIFSIVQMLKDVIDIIRPSCNQNNNTIGYHCDPEIGVMYSDFTKIRQSLLNLLSNATKFTKNGKLDIMVAAAMKDDCEYIIFSISDTGVGITPEQIKKLFKPFIQADSSTTRQFSGTGLGLAITKQFAEMLNGSIDVTSVLGQGSTFTLILPRDMKNQKPDAE